MKALLFVPLLATAFPLTDAGETIVFTNKTATFTNLQGRAFNNVVLVRADQDGLIWREGVGGGRVLYTNLPPDVLEDFGIPTNWVNLARNRPREKTNKPSDPMDGAPRPIKSDPRAIETYFQTHSMSVSLRLVNKRDLPKTEAQKRGCKVLLSELKQMRKMLELGISYNGFCDLLQQKAMNIEKLKDDYKDLPPSLLSSVDRCLKQWADSRKTWSDKIHADSDSATERADLRLQLCWAEADADFLTCQGIAEGNADPDPIYEQEAAIVTMEQKSPDSAGGFDSWFPEVASMSKEQIVLKLKEANDKRRKGQKSSGE